VCEHAPYRLIDLCAEKPTLVRQTCRINVWLAGFIVHNMCPTSSLSALCQQFVGSTIVYWLKQSPEPIEESTQRGQRLNKFCTKDTPESAA